ncbi:hypothetical protein BCV69DRAFT_262857 [Microstroma glucosiphilum]|uniref:DUF202 domain-containing protein n=1 Tax=Pseudomicrostroma glucosiphilum TaxID=1684307 RepID=A0A316U2U5_9BASI|nr:hypothetical protein BCV69DRAFT_262857 [Pseudomicrostroma glucosiphilum]PWN18811.1 hypothetical protein BCV69DRAFT_262857 [Pseudomicrostroma glucosiphilum]
MVLESIFGSKSTSASSPAASGPSSEREPLLANLGGERPGAAGYGTAGPSQRFVVPKPPRIKTPVRVETKVWLANERTWISWLHVSLLIGSFALALFNSSSFFSHHHPDLPEDPTHPKHPKRNPPLNPGTVRAFALVYAGIAVLTLSWGLGNYLRRVHLIKTRYAGSFDDLIGPPLICAALFIAVLLNFIVRVQEHNLVPAL